MAQARPTNAQARTFEPQRSKRGVERTEQLVLALRRTHARALNARAVLHRAIHRSIAIDRSIDANAYTHTCMIRPRPTCIQRCAPCSCRPHRICRAHAQPCTAIYRACQAQNRWAAAGKTSTGASSPPPPPPARGSCISSASPSEAPRDDTAKFGCVHACAGKSRAHVPRILSAARERVVGWARTPGADLPASQQRHQQRRKRRAAVAARLRGDKLAEGDLGACVHLRRPNWGGFRRGRFPLSAGSRLAPIPA